jgi:hypothetical protein
MIADFHYIKLDFIQVQQLFEFLKLKYEIRNENITT